MLSLYSVNPTLSLMLDEQDGFAPWGNYQPETLTNISQCVYYNNTI